MFHTSPAWAPPTRSDTHSHGVRWELLWHSLSAFRTPFWSFSMSGFPAVVVSIQQPRRHRERQWLWQLAREERYWKRTAESHRVSLCRQQPKEEAEQIWYVVATLQGPLCIDQLKHWIGPLCKHQGLISWRLIKCFTFLAFMVKWFHRRTKQILKIKLFYFRFQLNSFEGNRLGSYMSQQNTLHKHQTLNESMWDQCAQNLISLWSEPDFFFLTKICEFGECVTKQPSQKLCCSYQYTF